MRQSERGRERESESESERERERERDAEKERVSHAQRERERERRDGERREQTRERCAFGLWHVFLGFFCRVSSLLLDPLLSTAPALRHLHCAGEMFSTYGLPSTSDPGFSYFAVQNGYVPFDPSSLLPNVFAFALDVSMTINGSTTLLFFDDLAICKMNFSHEQAWQDAQGRPVENIAAPFLLECASPISRSFILLVLLIIEPIICSSCSTLGRVLAP